MGHPTRMSGDVFRLLEGFTHTKTYLLFDSMITYHLAMNLFRYECQSSQSRYMCLDMSFNDWPG